MTCREKLKIQHPEYVVHDYISDKESLGLLGSNYAGGCKGCPSNYGYLDEPEWCDGTSSRCAECWDREIPETSEPKDDIHSAISDILGVVAGGTGYIKIGLEKGKITSIYTELEREF